MSVSVDIETGNIFDPATGEIVSTLPYDYGTAKAAHARGSRDQAEAAAGMREAYRKFAEAERAYRKALAIQIIILHDKEGVAWTAAADLARGDEEVAELRALRDIAEGEKAAAEQIGWQASANRRGLEQLVDWSMRVAPLGQGQEPAQEQRPIGAAA